MTFFIVFKQGFEEIASHFDIANKYKMHFLYAKSINHFYMASSTALNFQCYKDIQAFFKGLLQNFILRYTQINKSY